MSLTDLTKILRRLEDISRTMERETAVYQAELADRQRRGLHGDAAIRHYNDWMLSHGMPDLMVTEVEP